MQKKYACALPFHHISMRPDGQIRPCCYFREDDIPSDLNASYTDPFNHPFIKDIRKNMSADLPVNGCKKCYIDEKITGNSMRKIANHSLDFGLPYGENIRGKIEKLTNIDLAFSNVCNNRCRMCGPDLSTNWYNDAKKLGIEIPKGILTTNSIIDNYNLSNLRYLKLIGGEPLMEQDKFIEVLKKCQLDKLSILLVTNTTILPSQELLDLLNQCRHVATHLSIDAFGPLNNMLRKGSDWNEVDKNVNWFLENMHNKQKFSTCIDSVVSIYNCNMIDKMIDYANTKKLKIKFNLVDGPSWMMIRNLPFSAKKELEKLLREQQKIYNFPIFNLILEEISNKGNFQKFITMDQKLNLIRNDDWSEYNRWLYDFFNEDINSAF